MDKILFLDIREDGKIYLEGIEKHQYLHGGYPTIKYKNVAYKVHRLVATEFLPNPDGLSDVNHKDGNKFNNHVSNLEWCTRSENIYHSLRTGLHIVEETPISNGSETFASQAEAARRTKAAQPNINKCLKGLRKSAGGYEWSYVYG